MHTFWRQEAHSVLSLSPPPPTSTTKKELNTNLRGKRLKQVVLFDFFFLSKEHYLFLSSVYLKKQFLIYVKLTGVIYWDLPSNQNNPPPFCGPSG